MTSRAVGASNDELGPDFRDFIVAMNTHGVEYVLVGGYALGVYGVVRATGDIDFVYRCTRENVARLCSALTAFGAPDIVIDPEVLLQPQMISAFGSPPHRIDLLASISGVDFDTVWAGARTVTIAQQSLRVIGLAELRANKQATGRDKDLTDLWLLPRI